jgi:beta-lactam-binding protein with PASTA domain
MSKIYYLFGLIFSGIIAVFLFNYVILPIYINQKNIITIPSYEGLTIDESQALAEQNKIQITVVDTVYSNDLSPNLILEQFPKAGKKVKKGRIVKVKITQWNEKISIPDLVGKTLRSAQIELDQLGVEVDSVYYAFNANFDKGLVSWQYPTPKDSLRKGFGIRLEVSQGSNPIDLVPVPDLQGLFLSEAVEKISESNLITGKIKFIKNERFLPKTVFNQNPPSNTKVERGTKIDLIINE